MSTLTKVFVVLQLVFALALSVLVVLFVSRENNYKTQVLAAENASLAAHASLGREMVENATLNTELRQAGTARAAQMAGLRHQLENTIAKLTSARMRADRRQSLLDGATTQVTLLTDATKSLISQNKMRSAELDRIRPRLLRLTDENAQLYRRNAVLSDQRSQNERVIRALQEHIARLHHRLQTLARAPSGGKPNSGMPTGTSGMGTAVQVNGRIRHVQQMNGHTYASISLGSRDGLRKGTRLIIYKNHTYVGDLQVTHVTPAASVGVVKIVNQGQKVQPHDMVISGPGI